MLLLLIHSYFSSTWTEVTIAVLTIADDQDVCNAGLFADVEMAVV